MNYTLWSCFFILRNRYWFTRWLDRRVFTLLQASFAQDPHRSAQYFVCELRRSTHSDYAAAILDFLRSLPEELLNSNRPLIEHFEAIPGTSVLEKLKLCSTVLMVAFRMNQLRYLDFMRFKAEEYIEIIESRQKGE
jgi:hypothetical protein